MYKSNKIFDAICYFQILPSKIYYDLLKDITIETYFYAWAYLDCLDDQYTVCQSNAIWSWQRLQQVVPHPEPAEKNMIQY